MEDHQSIMLEPWLMHSQLKDWVPCFHPYPEFRYKMAKLLEDREQRLDTLHQSTEHKREPWIASSVVEKKLPIHAKFFLTQEEGIHRATKRSRLAPEDPVLLTSKKARSSPTCNSPFTPIGDRSQSPSSHDSRFQLMSNRTTTRYITAQRRCHFHCLRWSLSSET